MESISSLSLGTKISNRSLDKKLKNWGMCLSALVFFPDTAYTLIFFNAALTIYCFNASTASTMYNNGCEISVDLEEGKIYIILTDYDVRRDPACW